MISPFAEKAKGVFYTHGDVRNFAADAARPRHGG